MDKVLNIFVSDAAKHRKSSLYHINGIGSALVDQLVQREKYCFNNDF
jgi:hypothetical protein